MRKFLVAAAVTTTALTAAAPAAAQYYPAPYQQPYYGQGQGYGQNNYGLVRSYQVRVNRIQRAIERADSRDRISEREARSLRYEARLLENRLRSLGYNGLNARERRDINARLVRLERRFAYELRDDNNRPGYGQGQYGNGWIDRNRNGIDDRNEGRRDRDRDGRDDRYEDDRGRYPG